VRRWTVEDAEEWNPDGLQTGREGDCETEIFEAAVTSCSTSKMDHCK
jgi:hypothetical protein